MIAFNKIIKKQIISLFVFFLFYFCCNHSFGQVQLYLSVKNYSQSISIKIENNKLQIGGDNRNVIIKPKIHGLYWVRFTIKREVLLVYVYVYAQQISLKL